MNVDRIQSSCSLEVSISCSASSARDRANTLAPTIFASTISALQCIIDSNPSHFHENDKQQKAVIWVGIFMSTDKCIMDVLLICPFLFGQTEGILE